MQTLILTNLSRGQQVKLRRLSLGWRQIDVASKTKLTTQEISLLEHDAPLSCDGGKLHLTRANRVLMLLGMRLILPGTVNSILKYKQSLEKAELVLKEYIEDLELELGISYEGITEITKDDITTASSAKTTNIEEVK